MTELLTEIATLAHADLLDVHEFWLERAAIREYLAGQERAHAEVAALQETRSHFVRQGVLL